MTAPIVLAHGQHLAPLPGAATGTALGVVALATLLGA